MVDFTLHYGHSTMSDGNMDFRFGKKEEVAKNRRKFFESVGIDSQKVTVMKISFSNRFSWVDERNFGDGMDSYEDAIDSDILLTDKTDITLALLTADCAPIIIFDERIGLLALSHVGSKNLANGTIRATIGELNNKSKGELKSPRAYIGPFIEKEHYCFETVPDELKDLTSNFTEVNGKYCLGLRGEIGKQLQREGINNIVFEDRGTYEGGYFSHRRAVEEIEPEGRFISYARIISNLKCKV